MKRIMLILLTLVVLLALADSALAMSSTNYRLDWFTPMTGSGGPTNSANYAVNFTVGQTVIGSASSTNYGVGLGYWYGADVCLRCLYLPLIMR